MVDLFVFINKLFDDFVDVSVAFAASTNEDCVWLRRARFECVELASDGQSCYNDFVFGNISVN